MRDRSRLLDWYRGEVRQGDLRDPACRRGVLEGVETVIHAASWTSVWSNAENTRRRLRKSTPCGRTFAAVPISRIPCRARPVAMAKAVDEMV
ncbi:MAG: hypothetical protein JKY68_05965 [Rhodospirillales bacterium]|nr:hypothetical protein [Rhodospirillales bacterium]